MARKKQPASMGKGAASWPPPKKQLERLVEEAVVDAYGDSEQRVGFLTLLQENVALPFETEVLGVPVTVERIELTTMDEIVGICRRGAHRQAIPILELPLPTPTPPGAEWIEEYRCSNLPASIHARLLTFTKQSDANFNVAPARFATERLLYRLSCSPHADRFVRTESVSAPVP